MNALWQLGGAVLLACCVLPAQDFRQATWGMSQAQVRATEPPQPAAVSESDGEVLVRYDSIQLAGLPVRTVYIFARDRLVRAKYVFEAEHAELNDFIGDFQAVEPLLKEKYGKPAETRAVWEDDSTQLEPKSYLDQDRASPANILRSDPNVGLAISLGHLRLFTRWEAPRTKVLHAMAGENHEIVHQLEYRSTELKALEDEVRAQPGAAGR